MGLISEALGDDLGPQNNIGKSMVFQSGFGCIFGSALEGKNGLKCHWFLHSFFNDFLKPFGAHLDAYFGPQNELRRRLPRHLTNLRFHAQGRRKRGSRTLSNP